MTNSGMRMHPDHAIYPKKLGIFILLSSAIDFTMKLGALPIYVLAPINTEPADTATSISGSTFPMVVATPSVNPSEAAVVRNTRYEHAI